VAVQVAVVDRVAAVIAHLQAVAGVPQRAAADLLLAAAVVDLVARQRAAVVDLVEAVHPRVNPRQRKREIIVKFSIHFWILLFSLF
jgi:hypothetical protein